MQTPNIEGICVTEYWMQNQQINAIHIAKFKVASISMVVL